MPPYADETWAHVRHAWLPQARAALAAVGVLRDGAAAPDHRIIDAPCPKCGVTPGEDCWDRAGGHPRSPHPTRVEAVRRAATPSGDTGSRA